MNFQFLLVLVAVVSVAVADDAWDRPSIESIPVLISHPRARAFTQNELNNITIDAERTIRLAAHRQLDHFAASEDVDSMINDVYGESISDVITLRKMNSILFELYSLTRVLANENRVEVYPVCHFRGHSKNPPIILMLPLQAHSAHDGHVEGGESSLGDILRGVRILEEPTNEGDGEIDELDLCLRRQPCDILDCQDVSSEKNICCDSMNENYRATYEKVALCGSISDKRGVDEDNRCPCDEDADNFVSIRTAHRMEELEETFEDKLIIMEEIRPGQGGGRPVKLDKPGRPNGDISDECDSVPVAIERV